jgi:Putative adhesin
MSRRHKWAWGVLLCLALVSISCDVKVGEGGLSVDFTAGKATDEWVRSYDIKPGGRLDIINVNGQIEASLSSGTKVEVRAIREARAGSEEASREMLQKTEMREEVTPDRVSIQIPEAHERGGGFGRRQLSIKYDVRIPPGLNILLKTQNGEVKLENIQGIRIQAASTNGGITGRRLSGAVEASTVNGGIQMDLDAVTGDTRMVTVNGGVMLSVAPAVNADLEATVVNGGVLVQDGLSLSGDERSRQRVAGRIGSGGPRLVVQTTNGGVRVGLRGASGS